MDFRSYIREFSDAILMLFRPSLWAQQQQEEQVAKLTSHAFLSVSEVTLGSFWAQL